MTYPSRLFSGGLLLMFSLCLRAEVFHGTPDNYDTFVSQLTAGDTLILAAGTYSRGLSLSDIAGTAELPITISGPEGLHEAVFSGRACCNTIQLQDASYITVQWLKIDGGNVDGIDGVNGRGVTHHITLENLLVVGHGNAQQTVGISTKGPAWDWVVRRNTVLEAGTGMYFGSSDGSAAFVRGTIEYNYVANSIGYDLQVKHQNSRPDGIGMPEDGSVTIIRHNVFTKESNYSTGALARPNLLVGHLPLEGKGSGDHYEIYGNFLFQNPSESLFQGEGNIHFHNNLLFNSAGDAIQIVPHNGRPRSVVVAYNTVVATGRGLNISGVDTSFSQLAAGNLVMAGQGISAPSSRDNIVDTYGSAALYLQAPFAEIGSKSLFPLSSTVRGEQISSAGMERVMDIGLDFNGNVRTPEFRGAYSGEGVNPGWLLSRAQKADTQASEAASVSLAADRAEVTVGEAVQLSWVGTNVDTCTASGSWNGSLPARGQQSIIVDAQGTFQFNLSCSGDGGTASDSVSVSGVAEAPPKQPPPTDPDLPEGAPGSGGGGGIGGGMTLALMLLARRRQGPATAPNSCRH